MLPCATLSLIFIRRLLCQKKDEMTFNWMCLTCFHCTVFFYESSEFEVNDIFRLVDGFLPISLIFFGCCLWYAIFVTNAAWPNESYASMTPTDSLTRSLQIANLTKTLCPHSSVAQFQISLADGILLLPSTDFVFHLCLCGSFFLSVCTVLNSSSYFGFIIAINSCFVLCFYVISSSSLHRIARCHCIDAIIRRLNCSRWWCQACAQRVRSPHFVHVNVLVILFSVSLFILHECIFDTCSFSRCRASAYSHTSIIRW